MKDETICDIIAELRKRFTEIENMLIIAAKYIEETEGFLNNAQQMATKMEFGLLARKKIMKEKNIELEYQQRKNGKM